MKLNNAFVAMAAVGVLVSPIFAQAAVAASTASCQIASVSDMSKRPSVIAHAVEVASAGGYGTSKSVDGGKSIGS